MELKHSPGPWVFDQKGDWIIRDVTGEELQGDQQYYPWVSSNLADWHLIAAAPELLVLLVESQESIGGDWRARRDAIVAKATGAA